MSSALFLALTLLFQGAPANPPTDALTFLKNVVKRYENATSYRIEATLEETTSNDLSRTWNKSLLTAVVAPGGRYRYEGRSGGGSAILVSDGTTEWDYHADERRYTKIPISAKPPAGTPVYSTEEFGVVQAKLMVSGIRAIIGRLKSASFLPDQAIVLDGRSIECRVVHFTDADFKVNRPDESTDETIWVDKTRDVIVKAVARGNSFLLLAGSRAHIPIKTDRTTVYSIVELDSPEPLDTFRFSPPTDAKLIASFPNPFIQGAWNPPNDFVGKPAPDVRLKRNGEDIQLSSYRGKPVFIDFWATSCEPCVASIPGLKKLYALTHDEGLVWIGVDRGDDPDSMAAFVAQEHIPWPNYEDENGSIGEAFDCQGIPLGVLIDPAGKVTFYSAGYSLANLQSAIAKLGPQFTSLAPKAATAKPGD